MVGGGGGGGERKFKNIQGEWKLRRISCVRATGIGRALLLLPFSGTVNTS